MELSDNVKIGLTFLIAFIILLIPVLIQKYKNTLVIPEQAAETSDIAYQITQPELVAEGVAIWDKRENEFIYSENLRTPYAIASITKILTAIVALETIPEEEAIVITLDDLRVEGESGLLAGEAWKINDLIGFMLTVSSNDAAQALGRVSSSISGVPMSSLMNQKALEIGMSESSFGNASGLDTVDGVTSSAQASPRDVIIMMNYFAENYPDIALASSDEVATFPSSMFDHTVSNTNIILDDLPHVSLSKTGFTYVAGGNLALALQIDLGREIYLVVLKSTIEERFRDMEKLYDYTREYITLEKI